MGGRREVQEGGDVYTYGLFMLIYSRNQHNIEMQIILQLKVNNFKIKKENSGARFINAQAQVEMLGLRETGRTVEHSLHTMSLKQKAHGKI